MTKHEKCSLIDELIDSFGYCYHCHYGFFSSTINAWQRKTGYTYLYDHIAPRLQMVFNSLPIYFNYNGRTWLIEFWKGQYGISTGAEIGIYHADKIVSPENYKTTLFDCASDDEMLPLSLHLSNENGDYVKTSMRHWWLTAFLPGCFSKPENLYMKAGISFPNRAMLSAFIDGLYQSGLSREDFETNGLFITILFHEPKTVSHSLVTRFRRRFSQWKNRIFCRVYFLVTKPFVYTEDRILFLYYFLPFAFRKTLRLHRFHKRCHRQRRCMRKPS
ncbi:MAG: DUF4474 domain-containing protein [Lachnospiraceae bacterium]|nr:DUF4474 domain-containing protein [Lachnospiraceae bacterium]